MKVVEQVAGRLTRARLARCAAVAVGLGSLIAGLGGGGLAALGLLAFLGARQATPRLAADRLDQQLDGSGAVRTAWDHRKSDAPMARAQRARVEAAISADHVRRAAPPPHPAWALALLLPAWPLLQSAGTPVTSAPDAGAPPSAAEVAGAGSVASGAAARPESDGPRASATRSAPSEAPASAASTGAAAAGGVAEVAGVGARAGDRLARPVTAQAIGLSEGTAAGIWLSDASGTALPSAPARVALAPPAGSPDDDVIDPARPYPRRYHDLIARWFER